jgi:hypothetical protein
MPHQPEQAERHQARSDYPTQVSHRNYLSNCDGHRYRCRYSERVTHPERQERSKDGPSLAFLQSERHREEPSHGGINAMKSAKSKQGGPGDYCRIVHGSPHE